MTDKSNFTSIPMGFAKIDNNMLWYALTTLSGSQLKVYAFFWSVIIGLRGLKKFENLDHWQGSIYKIAKATGLKWDTVKNSLRKLVELKLLEIPDLEKKDISKNWIYVKIGYIQKSDRDISKNRNSYIQKLDRGISKNWIHKTEIDKQNQELTQRKEKKEINRDKKQSARAREDLSYSQILEITNNTQLSPFLGEQYYEALCEQYADEPDYYVGKTIMMLLRKWFKNKSKITEPFNYLERALEHNYLSEPDNRSLVVDVERDLQALLAKDQFSDEIEEPVEDYEIYGMFAPYREHFPGCQNSDEVEAHFIEKILPEIQKQYPGYSFNPEDPQLDKLFREYGKIKRGD